MKRIGFISAGIALAAFAVLPLAAQPHWNNQPGGSSYGYGHHNSGHGSRNSMHGDWGDCRSGYAGSVRSGYARIGTVSSVDGAANTLQATDSDGKIFTVSINPRTVIYDSTETLAQRNNPRAPGSAPYSAYPKAISMGDLKAGDWISVEYYNSGTSVLDAIRIQAVKK